MAMRITRAFQKPIVRIVILGFAFSAMICIWLLITTEGVEPKGFCRFVTGDSGQLPLNQYPDEAEEYSCQVTWNEDSIGEILYYAFLFIIAVNVFRFARALWRGILRDP